MLKVGVTGGIGSGKSVVCKIFSALGIPVFDADHCAREIVDTDEKVKNDIIRAFGKDYYHASGQLNRKKMAAIVLADKAALKKLNAIVHPAVIAKSDEWSKHFKDVPYIIREAAILFE